jgi:hypothetical protein
LNKRDVELQKEKNILNNLPEGNGRRLRAKQIAAEQEGIRRQIDQLREQADQIRIQIAGTP